MLAGPHRCHSLCLQVHFCSSSVKRDYSCVSLGSAGESSSPQSFRCLKITWNLKPTWARLPLQKSGEECGCLKVNSFLLAPRLPGISLEDCPALELLTGMCWGRRRDSAVLSEAGAPKAPSLHTGLQGCSHALLLSRAMVELALTCCACKALFCVTPEELACSRVANCRRVNGTSCHQSVGIFLWICEPR